MMTRSVTAKKPQISNHEPLEPIRKFKTSTNYEDSYLLSTFGPDSNPNDFKPNDFAYENNEENNFLNSRYVLEKNILSLCNINEI